MAKSQSCGHENYRQGHCAEMTCQNYIGKCPTHWLKYATLPAKPELQQAEGTAQ